MKLSAILAPLLDAKVDHELIRQQILAFEAAQVDALEQRRASDARRQAEKREREKSRDVTLRHSDRSLAGEGATRVEDKTSNSETQSNNNTHTQRETDIAAFRRVCADGGLDTERTEALIKHRRAKRGAITGHAAALFRKDAAACGLSLVEATDTAISRNWITVKPEFLASRPRAGPAPPDKAPTLAQVFGMVKDRAAENEQRRDGSGGAGAVVLNLPAVRAQ